MTPNLVLRFVLELAALAGIGFGAAALVGAPLVLAAVSGLVAVVLAAVVWGLFRSPRARFPLPWPGRLAIELIVMGAGVAGWALASQPIVAVVLGVLAVASGAVNLVHEERAQRD